MSRLLDEETIKAAANVAACHAVEHEQRGASQRGLACRDVEHAIRALKSTPNQQVGRGERMECPDANCQDPNCGLAGCLYMRPAPAVSGEGWMGETAELLTRADEYLRLNSSGDVGPHHLISDLASAIRRHFPSPEGGGE